MENDFYPQKRSSRGAVVYPGETRKENCISDGGFGDYSGSDVWSKTGRPGVTGFTE